MRPEEEIRQKLLLKMRFSLGFPPGMIAVERRLGKLPHLVGRRVPDRRFDIVVFAEKIHSLSPIFPILIIECKAHTITSLDFQQVIGYNAYVQSPFIALANGEGEMLAWTKDGELHFQEGLLPYQQLIEMTIKEEICG